MTADGRTARIASTLALAAFAALAWWQNLVFKPWAGAGPGPDSKFGGYDVAWFAAWANELDPVERAQFLLWHSRVFDLAFSFFLAAALIALTFLALSRHRRFAAASRTKLILAAAALPLALFFLDSLENWGVANLLSGRFAAEAWAVAHVSAVTGAKWLFGLFAVALPLGLWLSTFNKAFDNV
jgi:hypothetical protein